MSGAAQAVLLVSASALCILLSPPPPQFQRALICAEALPIGQRVHILMNCDADSFVSLARDPSGVLEENSVRQTRPGYAVLGWVFSLPFRAFNAATHGQSFDPYYAGYVTLNWALMIFSVILFADLIAATSLLAPAVIVPVSVLLINHITKAFFWTPHQQIFGLFAGMVSIWVARRVIVRDAEIDFKTTLLFGLSAGIACLIYGVFVLLPLTVTAALWFFGKRGTWIRAAALTGILWLSTLAPFLVWRAYVIEETGSFYSHETQFYHEFVWIPETMRESLAAFSSAHFQNLARFLGTVPAALGVPIAFLTAACVLAVSRSKSFPTRALSSIAVKATGAFLLAAVPFYALMGFYDPRLTATLVVPLLVITAAITKEALESAGAHAPHQNLPEPLTIAALAYIAIVILIPGPYA
jgi:hypothetical protein